MTLRNRYDALLTMFSRIHFFEIGYVLYYCALFLEDLPLEAGILSKLLRYSAYLCFGVHYLTTRPAWQELACVVALFIINFVVGFGIRDFYWAITLTILFAFRSVNVERVLKMSFITLLTMTVVTLLFAVVGVLPNNNTMRGGDEIARYSMGFYHSNVFPLVVFHLLGLRILIVSSRQRITILELLTWVIMTVVTYFACGSRNALIGTSLCIVIYFIVEYVNRRTIVWKIMLFVAKWVVCFCVVFSVILLLLQGTNFPIAHRINSLFSGRFGLAYAQMKKTGLAFINTMPRNLFGVLDNGYLFVILRYGLLYIVLYILMYYYLAVKYRKNLPALAVFIIAAAMNMVDNDLLSYGFLPLMVMTVNKDTLKWYALKRRRKYTTKDIVADG